MRSVKLFRRSQEIARARAENASRRIVKPKAGTPIEGDVVVIRIPFDKNHAAENIEWWQAAWEMSVFAEITNTAGTEFERLEGKQVRTACEIDGMFIEPFLNGALKELLLAGCEIRTKKAVYQMSGAIK